MEFLLPLPSTRVETVINLIDFNHNELSAIVTCLSCFLPQLRSQLSNSNEPGGQVIRPPRRSSSVCRELPSLSQQQPPTNFHHLQQPASQQPQQHFFPASDYFQHQEQTDNRELAQQQSQVRQQQQSLPSNGHYTTPRGVQQHPQRVYADPRSFQHQQTSQNGVSNSPSVGTAAQLAVEAAARRNQQYASTSGELSPTEYHLSKQIFF